VQINNHITQLPGEDGGTLAARDHPGHRVEPQQRHPPRRDRSRPRDPPRRRRPRLPHRRRPARYALGDPAAPALVLNAVDAAGCMWVADTPDGWDAAEMTTPVDRKGYGDGGYAGDPTLRAAHPHHHRHRRRPHPEALDRRLPDVPRRRAEPLRTDPVHAPRRVARRDGPVVQPRRPPQVAGGGHPRRGLLLPARRRGPHQDRRRRRYGPVRLPTVGGEGGYPMGAPGRVMPWTAAGGTVASPSRGRQRRRRGLARRLHRHRAGPPPPHPARQRLLRGPRPPTSPPGTRGWWTPPPAPPPSTASTATTPGGRRVRVPPHPPRRRGGAAAVRHRRHRPGRRADRPHRPLLE
jgi:hypothetical protein